MSTSCIENDNTCCKIRNVLVEDLRKLNELTSELHSDIEHDQEYIDSSSDNISADSFRDNIHDQEYTIDSDNISVDSFDNCSSLSKDLQKFIIEYNISHNATKELLQILRKHGHIELPKDVRILVHTPRNASTNIKSLSGGHYVFWYFLKRQS